MDTLISAQKELVQQISRSHSNFKKTPKERLSIPYVQTKLTLLEQTWHLVQENHIQLLRTFDKKTLGTTDYFSEDVYGNAEDEYTWTKVSMLEKLDQLTPKTSHAGQGEIETSNFSMTKPIAVKIPVIKIPTFDGSYTEWYSFHDQFVSLIHENSSLSNVQKLHYLKSNVSGEAQNLIKNVATTDKNYEYAWAKLKKRFSNSRVIVNAYLHRMMTIRQIQNESATAIKNLLDTIMDCLSGLNSAGVKTDEWDAIIIYTTVNKLDATSVRQWEELISRENDNELPTWNKMMDFLESRFRSLEGILSSRAINTVRAYQRPLTNVEKKVYHAGNEIRKETCVYCNGEHYIHKCDQFIPLAYEEKKKVIENKNLCFNCLIPNHPVKYCKQRRRCDTCGRKHNSLIHPPENGDEINAAHTRNETSNTEMQIQSTENENEEIATHISTRVNKNVLLATALIRVKADNGRELQLRALIDQGSEGSFITESAAQALGLKRTTINGSIRGIGETATLKTKHMVRFNLRSNIQSEFEMDVNAYVLSSLTRLLPTNRVLVTSQQLLELPLADPTYGTPGKIDVLLGAAVYSRIIQNGVITGPPGTPLAQKTSLGWILCGEINTNNADNINQILSMHIITTEDENKLLRSFWEIESGEMSKNKRVMTEEELQCEKFYEKTHSRDKDGRFIVEIPIKDKNYDYGNTKEFAMKRLDQIERRLNRDKELKEEYTKVLMEYKDLGHMEEINKTEEPKCTKEVFYLPHHAVIRKDKLTSKVRIVFDASFHVPNHKSLNENMMVGPTIQRDLRHIVMSWREHKVAIVGDCVKMYRQIKVTQASADLQRVLWRINGELKEYRIKRVTFGTASAPYLATKTIQQLANDEKEKFPIAAEIAIKDIYMDDLLSGADNLAELKEIYTQMTNLLNCGGFKMQKWTSNDQNFVNFVEKEDRMSNDTFTVMNDEVVKTLGIAWNRTTDKFQYTINLSKLSDEKPTKRIILGTIARLFDPIGWLTPVIITAKIFIQKLWLAGVDWDQEIPENLKDEWSQYKQDLTKVKDIAVERWLKTNKDDLRRELHGYADASTSAYAAVIYLRIVKRDDTIYTKLITARSKVAPTKTGSVPRLELCGAVHLANLLIEVAHQLGIPYLNIRAYTDSTVVLAWLQSHPSRWKTFVANRTSEILDLLPSQYWQHVSSENNPADIASRGTTPSQLLENSLWWIGPEDLRQKKIEYNNNKENTTKLEEKVTKVMIARDVPSEKGDLFLKYSNLTKLLRVTAYILRVFVKEKPNHKHLIGREMEKAMIKCILMCQEEEYSDEIKQLKANRPVYNNSKLKSLNPFLDTENVIRVGGRLVHSDIPENSKHQVILPGNHPFTRLVLTDCHNKTLHGGPTLMLSHLRTRFWVPHAKSLLKAILHKCVTCTRYAASTSTQMMGSLPKVRITPARPFLNSGVDLAGPIDLRLSKGRGCKTQKGYIVIFICMVTKAIHIEIVTGLTAQDFIASFKRFVARRGRCKDMWSDNATNLTAGNKELMSAFDRTFESVRKEIENLLANDSTTWHHIPALAPHFGGLWEAGVKSIKFHLKRVLQNSTLTYEEMSTLTAQIEATLNSRPISPMSDDPSDIKSLTPGHFLIGEAPITVPEESYLDVMSNRLNRWQLTQRMFQDFWKRWSREYLTRLQQRCKWTKTNPNIAVGELVLLKEDNIPPGKWLMARVIETHPGKDNLIRVVTVKCKNSILKRPITKLCCLPVEQ